MRNKRRIVVTGLGVISSIGTGKDGFWKALTAGKSGVSKITSFDTEGFRCKYGGEIKDFDPAAFIPKRKTRFLGKTSQLAIAGAHLALEDAKLNPSAIDSKKFGIIFGTTVGERPMEELIESWAKGGLKEVDRTRVLQAAVHNIPANVGIQFKAMGLNCLIPTACAAGNYAIGYGYDLIRKGDLNFILAGGAEAFSHVAYVGFQRLYSMAPEKPQPFDKNRKGLILGEGAGVILLESLESALKRNAKIYAEVLGYGLSCDAYHITAPDPKGVANVMKKAIKDAGLSTRDVDYICAHGTGTPTNDKVECAAIKDVFADYKVPVSSVKSMLGHPMGAASAIEAAVCCLVIENSLIPPTINYETPDPECDIDCVPNTARKKEVKIVLNNGFAFGGNNCCVVFGSLNNK
ncbi:MAG: beta-ketoacyl-[acyl-carrier-protein] synthase family protein [Candidatus Omnitrophica bacterium]|nr:beta-ketoacyl-[acyl-carrier-protein] synthase family protein [Candidatus Omnitrophota bacterium]